MTVLVVMQPTFLPWAGFFDLIDQAANFVHLDTVQFSRQSWQQRNRIKTAAGLTWLSLPVDASWTRRTAIVDARIGPVDRIKKWRATLAQAYAGGAGIETDLPWIDAWLASLREGDSLADRNIEFIDRVCDRLQITTPRFRASNLAVSEGHRASRLIDLCRAFSADVYLSPPGAGVYLQSHLSAFEEAGIELVFQRYAHPLYRQRHGAFRSHASVLDLLLNEGDRAAEIFRSGRCAPIPADEFFGTARTDNAAEEPSD